MRAAIGEARESGLSLIEMMVAVLILAIGVTAGYRSLGQARRSIGEELPRLMARQAVLNRAEELRILGMAAGRELPGTVRAGPFEWQISVTEAATAGGFTEATITATAEGRPGALAVVYVRPPAP